jgi:hypothetical protein
MPDTVPGPTFVPGVDLGLLGEVQIEGADGVSTVIVSTLQSLRTAPGSGYWKAFSVPIVATAPSASQAAAGVGIKNILTGFLITFTAIAAELIGTVYFTIRDGATGAGTILAQIPVVQALGSTFQFGLSGMYVPGTANTAMTMELTNQAGVVTNPVGTDFATVLIWGNTEV